MAIKLTKKQRESLESLGINTVTDILNYFPYRYEILEFLDYRNWKVDSKVVIEATVITKPKLNYYKGRNSVIYFEVATDYDNYRISVFNRPWLAKLQLNDQISIVGKYQGNNRILALQVSNTPLNELLGIHPVYSLKDKITEKTFNKILNTVLVEEKENIYDFIPFNLREKYGYYHRYDAIKTIHNPTNTSELKLALDTLKYEEFLKFNLIMASRKKENTFIDESFGKDFSKDEVNSFIESLPFKLTDDQSKCVDEILTDITSSKQMIRLLQGDVGSGKTIVAFIAMYACALANKQAVLLAPTEILAHQHYKNMLNTFKDTNISIACLYSGLTAKEKRDILERIENGKVDLIVGTHAVFQEDVIYDNLGLIVTDEQQRFGVKQRNALALKANHPDILMMSATPIPRTMATTLYGDIDVSTISHAPNSNKKIHTTLIKQNSFIPVIKEIEKLLAEGDQMYVICPAIDNSSTGRNVNDIYTNLSAYFKGRYTVGLTHGQQDEETKQQVSKDFYDGKIDILVATTVIEVGVDVKSANIIVIYNANRFGLSQLHQLRGRVGRSVREGYCYLLSDTTDEEALNKLNIIVNNTSGFDIAYQDLKMRGPGDIMGFRQSGLPEFSLGNIIDDGQILFAAREDALNIIANLKDYPVMDKFILENQQRQINV